MNVNIAVKTLEDLVEFKEKALLPLISHLDKKITETRHHGIDPAIHGLYFQASEKVAEILNHANLVLDYYEEALNNAEVEDFINSIKV